MKLLSRVQLFVAHQAPPSMGFSRQEYCSGLPFPSPGDLPNPGIKPRSPTLQADSLSSETPGKPKNTGMGGLSILQGIFPTQKSKSNPALQADSLPAELPGKPKEGSSVHRDSPGKILEWATMPSTRESSQSRDRPRCPALQMDSLPFEPSGKSKNTGVGIFVPQGNFPT